jgi:hypothetical protein
MIPQPTLRFADLRSEDWMHQLPAFVGHSLRALKSPCAGYSLPTTHVHYANAYCDNAERPLQIREIPAGNTRV